MIFKKGDIVKVNLNPTIDLKNRKAKVIEKAPIDIVNTCNDYLHRLTDDIV